MVSAGGGGAGGTGGAGAAGGGGGGGGGGGERGRAGPRAGGGGERLVGAAAQRAQYRAHAGREGGNGDDGGNGDIFGAPDALIGGAEEGMQLGGGPRELDQRPVHALAAEERDKESGHDQDDQQF